MRDLIALLERKTGRRFDHDRFLALMERINEQEGYIAEAAELVGSARPCPVSITDQMPNTMIPQWHRGSDWAVAHARRFRDEVAARVRAGVGVAARERLRLMWIGAGVWHDTRFYQALEDRLGAVFVWSMYMPFAGPQYIRAIKGRPFEALASRICSMNEVLHLPPWMNGWMVHEARRCGIDAAVMLVPPDNRLSQSGTKLTAPGTARSRRAGADAGCRHGGRKGLEPRTDGGADGRLSCARKGWREVLRHPVVPVLAACARPGQPSA